MDNWVIITLIAVAFAALTILALVQWYTYRGVMDTLGAVQAELARKAKQRDLLKLENEVNSLRGQSRLGQGHSDQFNSRTYRAYNRSADVPMQAAPRTSLEPEPTYADQPELGMADLIDEAGKALQGSPAQFDSFADKWEGFGCSRWKPDGNARPLVNDGPASQSELWVVNAGISDVAYVFPSFGLVRKLTLLTADAGRPAEDQLGEFFRITRGTSFMARDPARIDVRTGRLLQLGTLEIPDSKNARPAV